ESMNNNVKFDRTVLPCLGRTAKLAGYYFMDTFHENGIDLSKEQWIVLKKLNDKDGQTQNDLAFITNRSKTSLTRLINTMEKKNLVFRELSKEDKRINHIYLSDLGKKTFLFSLPVLKKLMSELQDNISQKDLATTIEVLDQIQNNINKKIKLY
ncbi:MAG: MarR family transcriptional regulator, partial [Flavobacteriaceae bacterium]|nr:MarR family transcriptional regulator [Flavobacteriaceae bacterium]